MDSVTVITNELFPLLSFSLSLPPCFFIFTEGDHDSGVDESTQAKVNILINL